MPEYGAPPLRNAYRSFWVMEQVLEFHRKWMVTMTAGERALKNIVKRHAEYAALRIAINVGTVANDGIVQQPEGFELGTDDRCQCPICRNDRGESTS